MLSRKFLESMGLEADKVQAIIEAHTETVDGLKEKVAEYKASADQLPAALDELKAAKDELTTLKENGGDWEKKYNEEHAAFEDFKAAQEAEKTKQAKSAAYKNLLKEAGVSESSMDAIIKVTDLDKVELQEDGTIKDAETVTEGVKKEWAGFITTTRTEGAGTETPPGSTPPQDLSKLSMEEYIKARKQ